jgi:TATA-box binding protein (TBP) (component of TFIID and TFIIIB)
MEVVNSTVACQLVPPTKIDVTNLPNAKVYRQFPGVKVRFENFTAMIFGSGKINVLGYRTPSKLETVARTLEEYLEKAGYASVTVTCIVKNVVLSASLHKRINLQHAYTSFKTKGFTCILELEMYPGLRVHDGKVTSLVYHTGAVIVTGTSDVSYACCFMSQLLALLCE